MNNPIYKALEIESLQRDITERQNIIKHFCLTGQLDRSNAISKIMKLRKTDKAVLEVTAARLAVSSTPFEQCTNEQLLNELYMQMAILEGKLVEKLKGDTNHAHT